MGLTDQVEFPCERMPEDGQKARLLGIYPQRQEGLFMQRVRVPGGRIGLEQWRGLADLAARYTPDFPLHMTTRQDVELHGVGPGTIADVQRGIHELGLTSAGACGDTMRNITCCPSNGLRAGTWDAWDVVKSIQACVESLPWITDLPRKFKISVCGCFESCTRPWLNDLGLVANEEGRFRAVVAGSLGAKPGTGISLPEPVAVEHVLPLVVALLRLFHAEGDRKRRQRARLRHVRERLGDKAFLERVEELFHEERAGGSHRIAQLSRVEGNTPLQARLHLPLGDLMPDRAKELGRAVEEARGRLRVGLAHDLLVYTQNPVTLSPPLRALLDHGPVVACPGSTWCSRGIADSRGAAERIGRRLSRKACVPVAVSGCPNDCPHAASTSIGLIGRKRRLEGEPVTGFRVLLGGGQGAGPGLAREVHPFVPAEEIDEAVGWIVDRYREAVDEGVTANFNEWMSNEFKGLGESLDCRLGASATKDGLDAG
ncbi:MAG: nitrite/sulfite reductase [Pirellulaceae bacterium]